MTPGIVAGFSRLGLAEVDLGADGSDDTETGEARSARRSTSRPAINPKASTIAVSRADGVTRAVVAPVAAKNIFAGQGAIIDTGDDMDPIVRPRAFQFVELGEGGAGIAGGSRSAAFALFRMRCARRATSAGATSTVQVVERRCAADPVRRRGAGAGGAGQAAAAGPCRAGQGHLERTRPAPGIPGPEDRAGRRDRRLDWSPTRSPRRASG